MFSLFKYTIYLIVLFIEALLVQCIPTNFNNNYNRDIEKEKIYVINDNLLSDILKNILNTTTSSENNNNYYCGIRQQKLPLSTRIINIDGNEETDINEFPWHIALFMETDDNNNNNVKYIYNGGGTIIHPSIVMTVAHRVYNKSPNKLKIRAGQWNIINNNEINQRQDRNILKIIIHENYNSNHYGNNIALLILDTPFILTSFVNPICLPPENMNYDNTLCTATGWGKDNYESNGQYQEALKKIDLSIIPQNQCKTLSGLKNDNDKLSIICAGGELGKDTCIGDGGSALICPISQHSDQYYQIGMVATGYKCGLSGYPGLYTNIPYMRSWIDEHVKNEGFDNSWYTFNGIDLRTS